MFRFHETTRKRITRWAFVLLCAAPTLAMIAWIACRHRPGVVWNEATRLSGVLHVDVRLSDWRQPRPGVTRTSGMTLIEPGANVTLAALEAVEIQRSANRTRIAAAAVTLDAGHVDALHRRARAWLAALGVDAVRIEIDRLTIRGAGAKISFVLRGVQIRVDRQATGAIKAQLTAHTPAGDANVPELRVVLEQFPGEDGGLIRATVDARQAPLPSWVVATAAPLFAGCGADSMFRACCSSKSEAAPYGASLTGRLMRSHSARCCPPDRRTSPRARARRPSPTCTGATGKSKRSAGLSARPISR